MTFTKGHPQYNTGRTHFKKGGHIGLTTEFKKGVTGIMFAIFVLIVLVIEMKWTSDLNADIYDYSKARCVAPTPTAFINYCPKR